ncbi:MAG: hypothetical protein J6U55_01335, partial [Bacteroidaceae bacterium]|nr:hypothetical protein [Bacteroidaceae bacterium]
KILVAPQQRKAKQCKILIFNKNRDFFIFPKITMIVQASLTSRFLDCHATSAANHRGAKQRKKGAVYQGIL